MYPKKKKTIEHIANLPIFFAPIVEGMYDHEFDDEGMLPKTSLTKGEDGTIYVQMPMMAFEVYEEDPLPEGDQIGGLVQLEVNGTTVWTEVPRP